MAKKKSAKKSTKKRSDTQAVMDGVVPVVKGIESAAQELQDCRRERMQLQKTEGELQEKVLELMEKEGLEVYRCQTFEAVVRVKAGARKVSVKREVDKE